ncbi:MAG: hypothetical protein ABIQ56_01950 [Chitinophagaceae bacterium]
MQNKKELRAQYLEMISQWQQSGLSQKTFCATKGIRYHVFHYWYRVYRSESQTTGSFLPVKITPVQSPDQIIVKGVNGIEIRFSFSDQAAGFIKQLLIS